MGYICLLLLWLGVVNCDNKVEVRDLDLKLKSKNLGIYYYEGDFDNVFYSYYKPKKGFEIKSVSEAIQVVWRSQNQDLKCKYALVAYKNIEPHLVYLLLTNGEEPSELFYQKIGSLWREVKREGYKKEILNLKIGGEYRPITIFLSNLDNSPSYYVQNFKGNLSYRFFCPRYGFGAWRVYHKKEVWASRDHQARCVAAWAYKVDGVNIEYVKLLVTKKNGSSGVLEFVYSKNNWQQCVPGEQYANRPNIEYLENFIHPEYEFSDKRSEIKFPPFTMDIPEEKYMYNKDPTVMFIDQSIVNIHVKVYREYMDDVLYYHHHPKLPGSVTKILYTSEKIWSSYAAETCNYALIACENNKPALAYLYLSVNDQLRSLFLRKGPEGWVRTDINYYKQKIEKIKSEHKFVEFHKLNLYSGFNNKYYDISVGNGSLIYVAKYGIRIEAVLYFSHEIWASVSGERCVAVWAYQNEHYYMLKLLISSNRGSEILMFYRINNVFKKVDSIQMHKPANSEMEYYLEIEGKRVKIPSYNLKSFTEPPKFFYYPDYDFTPKIREMDKTYPMEEYEHIYQDYQDIYGPVARQYMEGLNHPVYGMDVCVSVDIEHPEQSLASLKNSVFDKRIEIKMIEPNPGTYFSKITQKGEVLYSQPSSADASVGVALYMINGNYILADVILASSRPASIHLEKVEGTWKYVSKQKFEERIKENKPKG